MHYFKTESFFRKVFCFLGIKSSLKKRAAELRILFRESLVRETEHFKFTQVDILEHINKKIGLARVVIKAITDWKTWKKQHSIVHNPPRKDINSLTDRIENANEQTTDAPLHDESLAYFNELDVTLRHKAFQLALHYWEGRWMEQLSVDIHLPTFTKKNEENTKNRWNRRAMLTPCFVSTFYMAPKFFRYSKFLSKGDNGQAIFDNPPLFNFVDLLIVDEAGQVSPEVGTATFALARQAVVVGDINQIEPVWNITPKIDIGNLKRGKLISSYEDSIYEKEYDVKGFLASTGSIMKMAQNACGYKEPVSDEKGVWLVEHKRCYDEIISYCNRLAYRGLLQPLRGKADNSNPFGPMLCIHVEGNSTVTGTTRYNTNEANAIAAWLMVNKGSIEKKYGTVEKAVGIITPFVAQANTLRYLLRRAGFDTGVLKLGTVHALQGAERPIVLFSMVYGEGDVGSYFFDRGNNMLNVAVSRAKDSFLVFANTRILNKKANSPSGVLAHYLTYQQ